MEPLVEIEHERPRPRAVERLDDIVIGGGFFFVEAVPKLARLGFR